MFCFAFFKKQKRKVLFIKSKNDMLGDGNDDEKALIDLVILPSGLSRLIAFFRKMRAL
jgi:hypothetical protein